jgi:lysophospholipase L1-like esterase
LSGCLDENFLVAVGDSFTSAGAAGGSSKSYPIVAENILKWFTRNFAKGGAVMKDIPGQLRTAAAALANATHVVFTIGGNDLGVASSLLQVILKNDLAGVSQKVRNLKPQLIN